MPVKTEDSGFNGNAELWAAAHKAIEPTSFFEKHLKEWILLGSLTICISPLSSLLTLIQSKGHLHFCDHLSFSVVAHTPAASYELDDVLHRLLLCTLENEGLL